jgi:hypothetical protein
MDIASLLEPVHGTHDSIVPPSSSLTSQQHHHYVLTSRPLPQSLQQAKRMSSISSTTSSKRLPVKNNKNRTTPEDLSASSSPTGTSPRHTRKQIKAACVPCRKRNLKVCYRLVSFLSLSCSLSPSLPTSKIPKLIYPCNTVRRQAPLLQMLYQQSDNLQLQRRSRNDATASG